MSASREERGKTINVTPVRTGEDTRHSVTQRGVISSLPTLREARALWVILLINSIQQILMFCDYLVIPPC